MTPRVARGVLVAIVAFVAIQLTHTVLRETNGVFHPYAMFATVQSTRTELWAHFVLDDGTAIDRRSRELLPIDFYRIRPLCLAALKRDARGFSQMIYQRLRDAPWRAFDEMDAAAEVPAGRALVGADWIDVRTDYGDPAAPRELDRKVIASWR